MATMLFVLRILEGRGIGRVDVDEGYILCSGSGSGSGDSISVLYGGFRARGYSWIRVEFSLRFDTIDFENGTLPDVLPRSSPTVDATCPTRNDEDVVNGVTAISIILLPLDESVGCQISLQLREQAQHFASKPQSSSTLQ